MNGLSDSQPWEIRAVELQSIAREIARDVELWAKGKRDHGLALLAFVVELLVATRERLRAEGGRLPDPHELEIQLIKIWGSILGASRNLAEADYLLGLLLSNELVRSALDPLFRAWREARTAAIRERRHAQPE